MLKITCIWDQTENEQQANWWGRVKRDNTRQQQSHFDRIFKVNQQTRILTCARHNAWMSLSKSVNIFLIGFTVIEKSHPELDQLATH